MPTVIQNRSLTTVKDLMDEYLSGVNGARPIKYMESTYGKKWRSSNTDTKFFCRCCSVYSQYDKLIAAGKTSSDAIELLESKRVERGETLSAFKISCKTLELA
jgi:hypothetical protein